MRSQILALNLEPRPNALSWQIKKIVGRIIPAIVTSTAVVAGLLGLELYKVVSGPRPLGTFRHSYLHLAENHFIRSVPSAPAIQWVSLSFPFILPSKLSSL